MCVCVCVCVVCVCVCVCVCVSVSVGILWECMYICTCACKRCKNGKMLSFERIIGLKTFSLYGVLEGAYECVCVCARVRICSARMSIFRVYIY